MLLRLGWSALRDVPALLADILVFASVCLAVLLITGRSFRSWRFVSLTDLLLLVRDIGIVVAAFAVLNFILTRLDSVPRSVPLIACFVMVSTMGGVRVLYRGYVERRPRLGLRALTRKDPVYVLAYGATAETESFLRSVQIETDSAYRVVGIIDDDSASRDRSIGGVKVIGDIAHLPAIKARFGQDGVDVTRIVLPASGIQRQTLSALVEAAAGTGVRVVRLPHAGELLRRAGDGFDFEPIKVTDLLGRDPHNLPPESISSLIRGKSVVVTGGGGSIGSELCRHLLRHQPEKLTIIDHCEFNLFNIERELAKLDRDGIVRPVLASIRDRDTIHAIFAKAKVDLVFHAAAYKHLPLVEANPIEGILTNVIGTVNVADAARKVGASAMIVISTDKAVKPSCVMGLSKRVAEMYCQSLDLTSDGRNRNTRFLVVRFGNVLGSSGSVVQIFEQQIRQGGPVTVTHPAMTRYFMTIPEAVELVLHASARGCSEDSTRGGIFVLDMGQPVPIIELARRMISLAGFVPEKDIAIEIAGIRKGEKLHEELVDHGEILGPADMPGVQLAHSKVHDWPRMQDFIQRLMSRIRSSDAEATIAMLRAILVGIAPVRRERVEILRGVLSQIDPPVAFKALTTPLTSPVKKPPDLEKFVVEYAAKYKQVQTTEYAAAARAQNHARVNGQRPH
jgi:O-antigen biosynthesis protein WbqV